MLGAKGGGQTVDSLLCFVVEDLDDLLREKDIPLSVELHGLLRRIHGEVHIETARCEEVFLREVLAVNFVGVHVPTSDLRRPGAFRPLPDVEHLLINRLPVSNSGNGSPQIRLIVSAKC